MEVVTTTTTAAASSAQLNQILKTMHPQNNAHTLTQTTTHIPQSLANLSSSINYSNQQQNLFTITTTNQEPNNAVDHQTSNGPQKCLNIAQNNHPKGENSEAETNELLQENGNSAISLNIVEQKVKETSNLVQIETVNLHNVKNDTLVASTKCFTESKEVSETREFTSVPDNDNDNKLEIVEKNVEELAEITNVDKVEKSSISIIKKNPNKNTSQLSKSITVSNKDENNSKVTVKTTQPRKSKLVVDLEPIPSTSSSNSNSRTKRQRIRTQYYQSPLPEVELVSKLCSATSSSSSKNIDEKLIVFYKNEFLAVRNTEGGFYLCQAVQNIYKSSSKIKIRWLSQISTEEYGEMYTPDFYDLIDFDCILTNLSLSRTEKRKYLLPTAEKIRTESILNRSLAVEKGEEISSSSLTEEHPDGLDLSLYRDEDQLKKRKTRKRSRKLSIKEEKPTSTPTSTSSIEKNPQTVKVRKIVTRKPVAKKVTAKKIVPNEPKPSTSSSKPHKIQTRPTSDQKAKVLAKISRKIVKKPMNKLSKTGNAAKAPIKNAQSKSSNNSQTALNKSTPLTRSLRKSTRK